MQKPESIPLEHIREGLYLSVRPTKSEYTFEYLDDAERNSEASYQILEGCEYHFQFQTADNKGKNNFRLKASDNIITNSPFGNGQGLIRPNTYVGTLELEIHEHDEFVGTVELEVQSRKTTYREEYRFMLESIAEQSIDLLFSLNSPVHQSVKTDFEGDSQTNYQRFSFIKAIVESEDFDQAISRVIHSPTTMWQEKIELTDSRRIKKFSGKNIRQLVNSNPRSRLQDNHVLVGMGITSIATNIQTMRKVESIDTPENRFIKHVLTTITDFCEEINTRVKKTSKETEHKKIKREIAQTVNTLESYLKHGFFKEISTPDSLNISSPVLQRKSGYREILKYWLMFDYAAQLSWDGGDDVYGVGKRNVAILYEYWLFFVLLGIVQDSFHVKVAEFENLFVKQNNDLTLSLKQGKHIVISGTYTDKTRVFNVSLSYNKSFGRNTDLDKQGSWTLQMDPDYTLSIWPNDMKVLEAEKKEKVLHIHFDSKYKVEDKENNTKFKRDDLIKMHAYKDAIRRTAGAYILYPGQDSDVKTYKGFHEILPGLGAFAIRPSNNKSGSENLRKFILDIRDHYINRATQHENIVNKTYEIIKNKPPLPLKETIPEYIGNKKLIPEETFVLVGYVNSDAHMEFYTKNKIYNFRMGSNRGSLEIDSKVADAKYLLLRSKDKKTSNSLWAIKGKGLKVYTGNKLILKGYPGENKNRNYLVYEIEKIDSSVFGNATWDISKLEGFEKAWGGFPFITNLYELLSNKF